MTTQPNFIIVGGGLAGAIAAQTLREEGFDGRITLLGEEPHRPYERPPLSKDYLQGKTDRDSIFAHPQPWYADHAVELRLGTAVTSLDPALRTVTTATGVQLGYDKLLLATGSTPRRISVPGADLNGVHYLRSVDDSERIKSGFAQAHRFAIIGAGWIGLETAAALGRRRRATSPGRHEHQHLGRCRRHRTTRPVTTPGHHRRSRRPGHPARQRALVAAT
jgi:3-phenylpropionate/trans-cinnamate dioxygenase ferredoxin reductase subunit